MSTLEERRAQRQRRRQQEDEASSVATVNGEDDLESRRRERREGRLRGSGGGDTDISTSDDYSSRRNRHRGSEDTQDTSSSYSSSRLRRHRNGEEDTPVVNDISSAKVPDTSAEDKLAERRRQQQEEEEEEALRRAEREAEEERQRQAAQERQRKEAEEAARRRAEQAERDRREEEERQRRPIQDDSFESGSLKSLDDGEDNPQDENKLFIDEDDHDAEDSVKSEKGTRKVFRNISVDKNEDNRCFNEDSHEIKVDKSIGALSERFSPDRVKVEEKLTSELSSSVREVNNNKIKDKLELFEHLKEEVDTVGRRTVLLPVTDGEGLKEKLAKFEQEIRDQEQAVKEVPAVAARAKKEFATPQPQKLSQKVQQFESAVKSQTASTPRDVKFELEKLGSSQGRRKAMLGRWSASMTHINVNNKPDVREANARKNVLERWISVEKNTQEKEPVKSPLERKESLTKRLGGNTEFIASRYVEKASKSIDESANLPRSPEPCLKSPLSPRASFTSSFKSEFVSQEVPDGSSEGAPRERKFSVEITIVPSKSSLASQWPTTADSNAGKGAYSEKPRKEVSAEEIVVRLPKTKVTDRWPHGNELTEAHGLRAVNGRVAHSRDSSMDKGTSLHSRESSMDKSVHSTDSSFDTSSEYPRSRWSRQPYEEEEAELERKQKEEEEARQAKMAEDDSKKKRGKRKGLGGLTPEKKKKLKQIIMQKAAEDLRKEALAKAQEKEKFINERVGPHNVDGLGEEELRKFIKKLHEKLAQIHSEAYDIEFKLNKQDKEVADLNMKISDNKGKFAKPVLRKVNKTEQKFAAMSKEQKKEHSDFRETLKSVHDDEEN